MNWQKWIGAAACLLLIGSCFMHWAYYPDIQKHFTGFNTAVLYKGRVVNYYGRPGILLSAFAVLCFVFHLIPKLWAKRANLVLAALCTAYAFSRFYMYTAPYSSIEPEKEFGLWLMLGSCIINLGISIVGRT